MRTVELRRHSFRQRPSDYLTEAGVALARRVGETIGPVDLVLTSPAGRARETALAMRYAIDGIYQPVQADWEALEVLLPEGCSFAHIARAMQTHPAAVELRDRLRAQWAAIAEELPERGRALVVSHGGYIDYCAVACLPTADYAAWGGPLGHCEGVRLAYADGQCVGGELLRVPAEKSTP